MHKPYRSIVGASCERAIRLQPGGHLQLEAQQLTRVRCLEGLLWLTQDGRLGDVVLGPGAEHRPDPDAGVLTLSPLRRGESVRLALESPTRHAWDRACGGFSPVAPDGRHETVAMPCIAGPSPLPRTAG